MPRMISVLNGVNLNLLGRRDPEQYGSNTLQHLETQVYAWAKEQGLTARCFQTNHEGAFVEQVHDAAEWAQGVIVNPGAWTHYAYAIRDALEFLEIPVVEVHISDIHAREPWRQTLGDLGRRPAPRHRARHRGLPRRDRVARRRRCGSG